MYTRIGFCGAACDAAAQSENFKEAYNSHVLTVKPAPWPYTAVDQEAPKSQVLDPDQSFALRLGPFQANLNPASGSIRPDQFESEEVFWL